METRFIIKTHTECLRPALYSLLILRCTSPEHTAYPQTVANRLSRILEGEGLSGQPEKREAAARFAVLIAEKHLKVLRPNMTWDWRGSALYAVLQKSGRTSDSRPSALTQVALLERIYFLKLFLEADGALLASLSEIFLQNEEVSRECLYDRLEEIVERLYESYIAAAVNFRERVQVKRRRAEVKRQLKGQSRQRSTLAHKVLPHLQVLLDLGLVAELRDGVYTPAGHKNRNSVAPLSAYANRLQELDRVFVEGNPYEVIAAAYGLAPILFVLDAHFEEAKAVIEAGYALIRDSMTGIAHIQAVTDWCCTVLLAERNIVIAPQQAQVVIDELYRRDPSAIRFHVDFDGNRSYIIMSSFEN